VVYNIAWVITYLYESLKTSANPHLLMKAGDFIHCLVSGFGAGRMGSETQIDICFMAIYNIIICCNDLSLASTYLGTFLAHID
jgi:hypothetical protein